MRVQIVLTCFTIVVSSIFLMNVGNLAFAIVYTNVKCGVSLEYPEGWTGEDSDIVTKDNTMKVLATFSPQDDYIDVGINIDNTGIAKKSTDELSEFLRDYAASWPDSSVIESKITEINGFPTHKIASTGGIFEGGTLTYFIIAYDRGYELTFNAMDKQEYDRYSSSVEKMAESIKISEPTFEGINC
jgi:hypothetical protein